MYVRKNDDGQITIYRLKIGKRWNSNRKEILFRYEKAMYKLNVCS